jgi:transposase
MADQAAISCPGCQQLRQQVADLQLQLDALRALVAQLQEQLAVARKDSSTSSKPPSSDLVAPPMPPPPDGHTKRSRGGQPGHPRCQRPLVPAELLTATVDYRLEDCPCCGRPLHATALAPGVLQQIELATVPLVTVTEHRSHFAWCPHCHSNPQAPLPPEVAQGGLAGPRLTTLIAYLKGVCHASFSTVRKFLRDVLGVTICRGHLVTLIGTVSQALEQPYQDLLDNLSAQDRLNVDETGHKDNGQRWWTWCFRASLYTLFKIEPTRSADVLLDVLGDEFDGVLGCDFFSAYRRYMRECGVLLQFCLAHLIRDVKFLITLPSAAERAYGERVREALRQLFAVIHRRDVLPAEAFASQLAAARDEVVRQGTQDVPQGRYGRNLAKRFTQYGECYFRFVTTPGLEPTNNAAEQAIRFVVIDRHITQGTRSESGRQWCERIWTVLATCTQQGRSVFDYLYEAVQACFHGQPAPSLLSAAAADE